LLLEIVYGMGIGSFLAAVSGLATLVIAHFLAADGDTFVVLQAVLDTQFWLAAHVVTVALGYCATFLAGLLGAVYIAHIIFRTASFASAGSARVVRIGGVTDNRLAPPLSSQAGAALASMIYGAVCFGMFFSLVGTVLGGLWADDSWGRFWGWDPKENGALIIVLFNALILHARWGGFVKQRGLAVLAVAGNIVTSWSWFGVNELGVGLHSYGFKKGVIWTLGWFVASQIVVILLGVLFGLLAEALPRRLEPR
jgi:ABC-type transport system involved in cytochrome c biogenesis permease subunit